MSNTSSSDESARRLLRQLLGKKRYAWVTGILLLVAFVFGKGSELGLPIPTIDQSGSQAETGRDREFRVVRVVDGDTFEIEGGERVRLIGIDTPETVKPNSPVECFGKESSDHLKQLIEGKSVRLEKDKTDRDRYARLLRYVYLGDRLVNEALVRDGFAKSVAYKPDTAKQAVFDRAEELARNEQAGRWNPAVCPN
ncbi:MAG: thermonuclease family protein [Undibacterium sp.]